MAEKIVVNRRTRRQTRETTTPEEDAQAAADGVAWDAGNAARAAEAREEKILGDPNMPTTLTRLNAILSALGRLDGGATQALTEIRTKIAELKVKHGVE